MFHLELPAKPALRVGSGAPSPSLGVDGDTYLDTVTGRIYYKSGGSWTIAPGGGMAIGGDVTGGTSQSVLFVDATGKLAQDNIYLKYNSSTKQLKLYGASLIVDNTTEYLNVDAGGMNLYTNATQASLILQNANASYPVLRLVGSTGGAFDLHVPNSFSSYALTLPISDGTSGQVLKTNGSGVLSWVTPVLSSEKGAANGVATLDASSLVPITQIPPAALERLVIVADQTARYALTTATVQNGDTVKQNDTGVMYFVKDDTNLGNSTGYSVYTAGTASAVAWSGVTGTPTTIAGYGITDSMIIGRTVNSATAGSVFFAGSAGVLAQNNSAFYWDTTNSRLGIGTTTTAGKLTILNSVSSGNALHMQQTNSSNSADALKIEDNGTGRSVFIDKTSTSGDAVLVVMDVSNPAHALHILSSHLGKGIYVEASNTGQGISVFQTNSATGGGIDVTLNHVTNSAHAISAYHAGTGTGLRSYANGSVVALRLEGGSTANRVEILGSTAGTLGVKVPATVTSYNITLPGTVAAAGQVLTDVAGDGTLSWTTVSSPSYKTNWITADGTTKVITHNLGTKDVNVSIYDKADDASIAVDSIIRTDTNTVTLTASEAPNASGWRVLIHLV